METFFESEGNMSIEFKNLKENIVLIESDEIVFQNTADALDIVFSANAGCVIVNKENIDESFFDLRTGFAGELLQKLVNYNCRLAIVGDFSVYSSKALKDFIYECNNGKNFCFVDSIEKALEKL